MEAVSSLRCPSDLDLLAPWQQLVVLVQLSARSDRTSMTAERPHPDPPEWFCRTFSHARRQDNEHCAEHHIVEDDVAFPRIYFS